MRTTIALDDDLLAEAQRLTGTAEKSALYERRCGRSSSARARVGSLGSAGTEPDLTAAPRRRPDPA